MRSKGFRKRLESFARISKTILTFEFKRPNACKSVPIFCSLGTVFNENGLSQRLQEKDLENSKSVFVYLLFCSFGAVFNKMVYLNICKRKFQGCIFYIFLLAWVEKINHFNIFSLFSLNFSYEKQIFNKKNHLNCLKKTKIRVKKFRHAPRAIIY